MAAPVHDKYYLRSLHEEIDLFDRKLAHLLKYEEFKTDALRDSTAGKMQAKRDLLARTARLLASEGIEFKESELPRSFRSEKGEDPHAKAEVSATAAVEEAVESPLAPAQSRMMPSPFEGTVLDGRAGLDAYKRSRTRLTSTSR